MTSSKLQPMNHVEKESSGDESDQHCYMVQGNNSLEIYSDTLLDVSTSSFCNECMDAHASNEELSIVCEKLLSKYKVLKKKRVLN